MKRRKFFGVIATCAALTCTLVQSNAFAADKTRLRFQTYYGTEMDSVTKQFVKNVKEWSNGELRIQLFRGGDLVSNDGIFEAVSKGTLDMGHGVSAYWSGQVDMGNLETGIPGAWASVSEAKDIFLNQGFSDLVKESYAEHGVYHVTNGFGGRYDLLTKEPVQRLDDLKNMKIRASTQAAAVLKELDIPSVNLPAQELYVGLSTGVIDGVIYGGPFDYEALKLHETARHYTTLNMLTPGWTETYMVNQKKWDSLSKSHQDILTRAYDQMADEISLVLANGDKEILAKNLFEMNALSPEDSGRLTQAAQNVWNKEGARSDRTAKAVAILRANAEQKGRL